MVIKAVRAPWRWITALVAVVVPWPTYFTAAPVFPCSASAFFRPASSGAHEFYLNNDDEAELRLSTDQSAANLQSLGIFPLNAPPFDANSLATSPALTADQTAKATADFEMAVELNPRSVSLARGLLTSLKCETRGLRIVRQLLMGQRARDPLERPH